MARPAPVERVTELCTFSSGAHRVLEEAEATRPKVLECSYFLEEISTISVVHRRGLNVLTSTILP